MNVSESCISHFLHKTSLPGIYTLIKFADALDVSLDWLLGRDKFIGTVPNERISELDKWGFMP